MGCAGGTALELHARPSLDMSTEREAHQDAQASWRATALFLAAIAITTAFTGSGTAIEMGHNYALGIGLGLLASIAADFKGNVRNLVRADIMALSALYFLTLSEFVIPGPNLWIMFENLDLTDALHMCALGFAGLILGRHITIPAPAAMMRVTQLNPQPKILFLIFVGCLFFGYVYMAAAVDFNLGDMVHYFMTPRFTQPWGRGKFGDWRALLYETGMVLYLVPPLAGIILAGRKNFTKIQVVGTTAGFLFTLFYGYTSGTRNIFATYLVTFLVAYAFAAGRRRRHEIIALVILSGALMVHATSAMLEFRNTGFLEYVRGAHEDTEPRPASFSVDNNLFAISRLIDVFPAKHEYLGWEIPYLAIIRPIPRALWNGKPEGMSYSIEQALNADGGFTISATFIGEAYMSGGVLGVGLCGLILGSLTAWWNRLGRENNTPFGFLIFASGFFAVVMSMRSLLVFTTAILPTIAALLLGYWIVANRLERRPPPPAEIPDE